MNKRYKGPFKNQKQHKTGEMNKTEKLYSELLQKAVMTGEVERWEFEKIKFKLGKAVYYLPDFYVVYADHIEMHEVKGAFITDKGMIKFKTAAELFPEFRWKLMQYKAKTGWNVLRDI